MPSDEDEPAPRVVILDDHAVLAEALAVALRLHGFDDVRVVVTRSQHDVVGAAVGLGAEVVLLALDQAGTGVEWIAPLAGTGVRVLVLASEHDRPLLARCVQEGAAGVFNKARPFEDLVAYLMDAARGRTVLSEAARLELLAELREHDRAQRVRRQRFESLTATEQATLAMLVEGRSAEEIAASRAVSMPTVRTHIRGVLQKLEVNSQLAAVAVARRAGWEPPAGEVAARPLA